MKVVCIKKGDSMITYVNITVGKIYETLDNFGYSIGVSFESINNEYYIENDKLEKSFYRKDFFISIEDYRDKKLDNVLK